MKMKLGVLLVVATTILQSSAFKMKKREENYEHLNHTQLVAKFQELNGNNTAANDAVHFHELEIAEDFVETHNHEPNLQWEATLNSFSTMTAAEKAQFTGVRNTTSRVKRFAKRDAEYDTTNPDSVDYTDLLPSIKFQSTCSSCWAFGAIGPLEYQVNKGDRRTRDPDTGDVVDLISLSEQQYLNCVYDREDGCDGGGDPWECWVWNNDNGLGLPRTSTVSYTADGGSSCYTGAETAIWGFKINGVRTLSNDGDSALTNAVADADIGVLTTNIAAVDSLYSYSSGIYTEDDCSVINHSVVVVGYGVSAGGTGYFKIRNSWGDWGDDGYAYFARGIAGAANINTCLVATEARYPRITGALATDVGNWCEFENSYLNGYETSVNPYKFDTWEEAALQCLKRSKITKPCKGFVLESTGKYTLRTGKKKKTSDPGDEETLWKNCWSDITFKFYDGWYSSG